MSSLPAGADRPDAGHLLAHLRDLAQRIPVTTIDELWTFPTRRLGTADSTVLVVSAFAAEQDRRRIFTAHYTARPGPRGQPAVQATIAEHGSAPADRVVRLIDGVLRRLDPELAAAPPRSLRIGGVEALWDEVLEGIGGSG